MPDAVVFDFDGVIVDTEPLHHRAFCRVLAPYHLNCTWDEYLARFVGLDDRGAFNEFFRNSSRLSEPHFLADLIDQKAEVFAALAEEGVDPYPGVVELIRQLETRVPLSLCTGALPSDIAPILKSLALEETFQVVVTAADVETGKPDPEGYRLALAGLQKMNAHHNIRGESVVAIEDTPPGIRAALGAGLKVLAVTTNFPPSDLGEATRIVESLGSVSFEELSALTAMR